MQLLLIRHAQPEYARVNLGRADPSLTEQGLVQAGRLVEALAPYRIALLFSSPQLRALQTAQPLADRLTLPVEQIAGLAEYDYELDHYIPFETAKELGSDAYQRILAGHLPDFVDAELFRTRVLTSVEQVVSSCAHEETAVVVAHGGVINIVLQDLLGLELPLAFPIEYASVTRLLVSRAGRRRVASINETGHVRDTLRV